MAQGFSGTRRYEVLASLGAGGSGAVYAVHDRLLDQRIALKALREPSAERTYQLKREFRTLADVRHPNLVELHELVSEADTFFTMELVPDAQHFLAGLGSEIDRSGAVPHAPHGRIEPSASLRFDPEVLADRLVQLAAGLAALHERGIVHGDVKPSNVLIDPSGRVVIVDFGLAHDLALQRTDSERALAGTPGWLAPERLRGEPATPAGDWYAVGAMLVLALTGQLPIATPTRALYDPVPERYRALVQGLLAPAAERAGELAIRALQPAAPAPSKTARPPFVGRSRELELIEAALALSGPGTVLVSGESGVGKSALVGHALAAAEARGTLVLRGRGRPREVVGFPVLDAVTDDLSRHLSSLDERARPALSELERLALHRLFPVLGRVPGLVDDALVELEPQLAWRAGVGALASSSPTSRARAGSCSRWTTCSGSTRARRASCAPCFAARHRRP